MHNSALTKSCAWVFAVLVSGASAHADPPSKRSTLNPMQHRGKQIYLRGEGGGDTPVWAILGDPPMPVSARMLPCVNCHGYDGRGIPEGGVTPSHIAWSALTKRYGTVHAAGRRHGPYNESTLKRAIAEGIDPSGNALGVGMPKYQMSDADIAALIAYLKCIETDRDPGVTESTVTIATVLPLDGPLGPIGHEIKNVLTERIEEINRENGIYNRRIELRVIPTADSPDKTIARVRTTLDATGVFALVAPLIPQGESQLATFAEERGIPVLASLGTAPDNLAGTSRHLFYLLPSPYTQARALAALYATRRQNPDAAAKAVLVARAGAPYDALSEAIIAECRTRGIDLQVTPPYSARAFSPELLAWQQVGTSALFFVGPDAEGTQILETIAANGHPPEVFLIGAFLSDRIFQAPNMFQGKITAVFPNGLAAQTEPAAGDYRAFLARHAWSTRNSAPRRAAYCAAGVLYEVLKKSGRELRRERFMHELEGFWDYETGLIPPITYGPNRRIGAYGAYPVSIDLKTRSFDSTLPWIELAE